MGVGRGVGREGGETGRGSRGRVTVKLWAKRSATNVAVACAARATHTHTRDTHTQQAHTLHTNTHRRHTHQTHSKHTLIHSHSQYSLAFAFLHMSYFT